MNSRSIDEPGSPAEPIPGGSRSDPWQSGLLWARNARNLWHLTKPKVVGAIVFTAVVGMMPAVGIWLAAATLNHIFDRRLDGEMMRTCGRPLPQDQLTVHAALAFAATLCTASVLVLLIRVNLLTAILTFASLIGYSVLYTLWLKHATLQNIVIGGAAGAAPPILGWAAVTNSVDGNALLLSLIIFTWTPPHFWALAIARRAEYSNAGIPMLPATHGVRFTCTYMLLYTILLVFVTTLPYLTGMSGPLYIIGAIALNGIFARKVLVLNATQTDEAAMDTFIYSIKYLLLLFTFLLSDHYMRRT
jgi:protoheme IX farnesyltransferase